VLLFHYSLVNTVSVETIFPATDEPSVKQSAVETNQKSVAIGSRTVSIQVQMLLNCIDSKCKCKVLFKD